MIWYIVGLVVAFICGAAAISSPLLAIVQLNAWELGRMERIRKAVSRECAGCSRVGRIIELIDKERTL